MAFRSGGYTLLNKDKVPPAWIKLFEQAWERLHNFDDLHNKQCTVVFAIGGKLVVDLVIKERIAEYWRDLIVYNVEKMQGKTNKELEVIFLEELVHCFFDSLDETAVSLLVASQIPGISFDLKTRQYVTQTGGSK